MPKQTKVLSYEDKNYKQNENVYSSLVQCLSDLKHERSGKHHWNIPIEQLNGVMLKLVGKDQLSLTYHRIETGTADTLAMSKDEGKKFLKEVEKELKSRYKKFTKTTLKLKKVNEDRSLEKYSFVQADTSWMVGSSRYGYGNRAVARFYVKDTIIYSFDTDLLDDEE